MGRKPMGKKVLCPHEILGKINCPLCQGKILRALKSRKRHPKKAKIYNMIHNNPERYPMDDKCIFCGTTENLERAHLDYEDDGFNYVTACGSCNMWMGR